MSTPLAKRLNQIMKACDWKQSDLARAAGCPRQTVSSWINGPNENMHNAQHAVNLQRATGFNAVWILTGEGPAKIAPPSPTEEKILARLRELSDKKKATILDLLADL